MITKMAPDLFINVSLFCLFLHLFKLKKTSRRPQTFPLTVLNRILFVDSPSSRATLYQRRRNQIILTFVNYLHKSVLESRRVQRSLWIHERSGYWWNYIVKNTFSEEQWVENFRMRKGTFDKLCDSLRPYICRRDTSFRKCIPVEMRVAISLWILGTPCEYRTVAHLFGISRTSVCLILRDFCKVVKEKLSKRYIRLPDNDELCKIMLTFEQRWGFPNCGGAIDGCHIPIVAPQENHTDYYNRKGWYSILLQAVVDSNYLFRDTCIGWPGRVHDARVLANSKIYDLGQEGSLFPKNARNISGVTVPVVILGDPAYPLLQWLMKPYPDSAQTTPEQKRFNYMLSRNRMVVENAFGRLKGRWRRLQKRVDCDIKDTPNLILTCCVLHNICETQGEEYLDQWDDRLEQPAVIQVADTPEREEEITSAANIRNAFSRFFQLDNE